MKTFSLSRIVPIGTISAAGLLAFTGTAHAAIGALITGNYQNTNVTAAATYIGPAAAQNLTTVKPATTPDTATNSDTTAPSARVSPDAPTASTAPDAPATPIATAVSTPSTAPILPPAPTAPIAPTTDTIGSPKAIQQIVAPNLDTVSPILSAIDLGQAIDIAPGGFNQGQSTPVMIGNGVRLIQTIGGDVASIFHHIHKAINKKPDPEPYVARIPSVTNPTQTQAINIYWDKSSDTYEFMLPMAAQKDAANTRGLINASYDNRANKWQLKFAGLEGPRSITFYSSVGIDKRSLPISTTVTTQGSGLEQTKLTAYEIDAVNAMRRKIKFYTRQPHARLMAPQAPIVEKFIVTSNRFDVATNVVAEKLYPYFAIPNRRKIVSPSIEAKATYALHTYTLAANPAQQPPHSDAIQLAGALSTASTNVAPPLVARALNGQPELQIASYNDNNVQPALALGGENIQQPVPQDLVLKLSAPTLEDTPVILASNTEQPRHRDNAVYYQTNTNGPTNGDTPGGGSSGGAGPGATPTTLASIAHDDSALFTDPLIRDGNTAPYKATFVSAANDHMPNNNIGLGALAAIGMMGITSFGFGRHKQIRRALGRPTPRPLTGLERAYGEGYGKVTGLEGVYGEGYGKDFLYDSSWTKNRLQRNTAKFPGQNITVAIGKHLQNNWGSILASGIAGSLTSIGMKAIGIKAAFALAAVCVGAPAGVIVIPVVLATGVAAGFSASVVSKFVSNGVKELQKAPGQKSWKNWLTVSSAQAFNWKSFGLSAGFGILGASIGLAAHYQQVIEGIKHAQHVTDLAKNATANANLHAGHVNATVHADPTPAMPDIPAPPAPQPTDLQGMLQSSDLGAENAGLVRKALAAMSHHHSVSAMARVRDIVGQLTKSNVHEAANLNQAALDYGANHHIDSGRVFNVLRGNQSYLNAKLAM